MGTDDPATRVARRRKAFQDGEEAESVPQVYPILPTRMRRASASRVAGQSPARAASKCDSLTRVRPTTRRVGRRQHANGQCPAGRRFASRCARVRGPGLPGQRGTETPVFSSYAPNRGVPPRTTWKFFQIDVAIRPLLPRRRVESPLTSSADPITRLTPPKTPKSGTSSRKIECREFRFKYNNRPFHRNRTPSYIPPNPPFPP